MTQRILAVLAGALVVFGIGGWGRTVDVQEPGQSGATVAVRTLGTPDEVLPVGFAPHPGGCSSPIGGSPYGFTAACVVHDQGYDLLRYADDRGAALGPWARKAVDARFARQTMAGCHDPGCRLMARIYSGAVQFNSWRQGYGVPRHETPLQLFGPVLAGLAVTAGLLSRRSVTVVRPVPVREHRGQVATR
ncbi:hypothetical protein GCM10022223_03950 [Kineosporia mesophila]|uniref:Phospholipase A2 n=1 Tax=Kineosporia mesophila TaxID=566012 RepID=A0ABP6YVN4_9ACTN|nr:hypothetical protein [Kineosporia mesophila]MCD5351875.1 hypothetical protein [Kineosporia mesophila]